MRKPNRLIPNKNTEFSSETVNDTTCSSVQPTQENEVLAIRISEVSFTYPGSEQAVLKGASLSIPKGSFIAIMGSNGCGKSTLCKLFNGLIPHYYSGDYEGHVEICGFPTANQSVAELSRMIGYVYQDFDNQLVRPTVQDEAFFAPLNYGLPDYKAMGWQALELCGLTHLKDRYIWELSGGQKHLLALAGALSLEPEILVVDEPVSQLDPQHARQVYEVLRQLNQDYGKTIVVIEHHTEFIAEYCSQACLMEEGKVLWSKPAAEALNSLADLERLGIQPPEVTKAAVRWAETKQSSNSSHKDYDLEKSQQSQLSLYPVTVEEAVPYFRTLLAEPSTGSQGPVGELPLYNESESVKKIADTQREPGGTMPAPVLPIIELNQVSLSYRTIRKNRQEVFQGLNLSFFEGERIALIGNNGAGKSSLLKLIAGINKPSGGRVTILGQNTKELSIEQISTNVGFVFQNPEEMFIEDNVFKEVLHCLKARKFPEAETRTLNMLRHFRLESLKDRDARLLSGGQQRRVSLAIGAASQPKVILLDEPTANLDLATREELLATLEELEAHVRTVIIATHDMQLVHQWATRVIVLNEGQVISDGTAEAVFSNAELIRRAGLAPTQMMELSSKLGLNPASSSPAMFVERIHKILQEEVKALHAVGSQLV